jgi:hypothetical protein
VVSVRALDGPRSAVIANRRDSHFHASVIVLSFSKTCHFCSDLVPKRRLEQYRSTIQKANTYFAARVRHRHDYALGPRPPKGGLFRRIVAVGNHRTKRSTERRYPRYPSGIPATNFPASEPYPVATPQRKYPTGAAAIGAIWRASCLTPSLRGPTPETPGCAGARTSPNPPLGRKRSPCPRTEKPRSPPPCTSGRDRASPPRR